jgi:hypothetical protein
MVSAASTPDKSLLVLVSFVTVLLVLISVVESSYDDRHAVTHSAVPRRSRLGTRHVKYHRRTTTPHRYVLTEKSNTTVGSKNNSSPATSEATSSMTASRAEKPSKNHRSQNKHRVRNWIVGSVVVSLAVVVSGLVLFRLGMVCIRRQCMARPRMAIFTPKLIMHVDHLAFLEEEDGVALLEVIRRGGCGEVYRAQLPGKARRRRRGRELRLPSFGSRKPAG